LWKTWLAAPETKTGPGGGGAAEQARYCLILAGEWFTLNHFFQILLAVYKTASKLVQKKGLVMATLQINGQTMDIGEIDPSTPLLWVLRDELGLVGTKYGCGIAQCGACTVHLDGAPVRSCQIPVGNLTDQEITTIEGLAAADGTLTPVQEAWIELDVPQCGYCQAGQIMSATALLRNNPNPSDADIDAAMSGNICRCATYTRIRQGIKNAAAKMNGTAFYDAANTGETA
jgi:aerobic-type carbon monoxide dehydrogenase small subunit (CoxS/CutS family)